MNAGRVRAIVAKELLLTRKNRLLLFTILLLPLVFTVVPLTILGLQGAGMMKDESHDDLKLALKVAPETGSWAPVEAVQVFVGRQFLLFYLIMPLILPMTIATHAVIGEKQERSLEPLLAAPITTGELLFGKSLAAAAPGLLATWLACAIYLGGARFLVVSGRVYVKMFDPLWLGALAALTPLLALQSVAAGLMISSRVNDPRTAQTIGGLLVLPVIAVGGAATFGLVALSGWLLLAAVLVAASADYVLLRLAVWLFERETILTRWK